MRRVPTYTVKQVKSGILKCDDFDVVVFEDDHINVMTAAEKEIVDLKQKLTLASIGQGHFKSERDIHIKESEQFVKDAVTKLAEKDQTIKELKEALKLLEEKHDGVECRLDHHGLCQEHYLEQDCSIKLAREVLKKLESK